MISICVVTNPDFHNGTTDALSDYSGTAGEGRDKGKGIAANGAFLGAGAYVWERDRPLRFSDVLFVRVRMASAMDLAFVGER